ncbi:MAG: hypothetical protein DMG05_05080 [Acidobacteria bacterium]|nr:MAG: hypothetical protein DMG05_05080 [Acidobacteriota bacterium]
MAMIEEPNQERPDFKAMPEQRDEDSPIHFELVEPSIPPRKIWLGSALLFSVFGLWFVYKVTFTDVAEKWLPYTLETAQVLVPEAPDGQEPIELLDLTNTISENRINIQGKIRNRTHQPIEDLMATINLSFVSTVNTVVKDVPLVPTKIEPGFEALFQFGQPINDKPAGFSVKFKLANGGIVRHKDSRLLTIP